MGAMSSSCSNLDCGISFENGNMTQVGSVGNISKYIRKNLYMLVSITAQNKNAALCIPKGVSNDTPCTIEQIKQLREKVGILSWISKDNRVDLAGSVSLLMQAFPCPPVGDLKTCNKILKEAKLYKDIGVTIRPVCPQDLYSVVFSDAA